MASNELLVFVDRLNRSGLLATARCEQVSRQLLPGCADAESLVRELIRRGWLTPAQARELLAGRGFPAQARSRNPTRPRQSGGFGWAWVAAAALLMVAATAVGLVWLAHWLRTPAESGNAPVAAAPPTYPQTDPGSSKLRPLGNPPSSKPAPPAPKPPTVAIDHVDPATPVAGQKLTVYLSGTSPDQQTLRYQYRLDPRGPWQPAPASLELGALQPGTLTLQVQAVDARGLPSPSVQRTWTVASAAPAPPAYTIDKAGVVRLQELPPVTTDNKSSLIRKYRTQISLTASTTWGGWPPENAVDDNIQTSWFSGQNDAAAHGTKPWLQVNFPIDVPVSRVTILGNRDPAWLVGFTILEGSVTLYDKDGKVRKTERSKGTGNFRDFDFRFNPPIEGVRAVRFTSLADQGNQTTYGDIAIAEIQVD